MNNIKKHRGSLGLSQQQLADKIGVSRATIIGLENYDNIYLSIETAKKLSELFNCSIVDVYGVDILRYVPRNEEEKKQIIDIINELSF